MTNDKEIIEDKYLIYLFLIYITPFLITTGLTGLLRGKTILRYITIEGPIGIIIDYIYIIVSVYFLIMFTYLVVVVMKQTVIRFKIIKICLVAVFNLFFYGLYILYVLDEYYAHLIIKNWLDTLVYFIALVVINYVYITFIIYRIFKLIKIIE